MIIHIATYFIGFVLSAILSYGMMDLICFDMKADYESYFFNEPVYKEDLYVPFIIFTFLSWFGVMLNILLFILLVIKMKTDQGHIIEKIDNKIYEFYKFLKK